VPHSYFTDESTNSFVFNFLTLVLKTDVLEILEGCKYTTLIKKSSEAFAEILYSYKLKLLISYE